MSPRSRRIVGTDLQLTQHLARTVRMTLPRREAASRMGVRLGRLGELPYQTPQEAHRGVRSVTWRRREVDILQDCRDALLRERDLFEVRVAVVIIDGSSVVSVGEIPA